MTIHTAEQDSIALHTTRARMRAGAGVEDEDFDLAEPPIDEPSAAPTSGVLDRHVAARLEGAFPEGVAAELAELRDAGIAFADAWAMIDASQRARDAGFTWKSREGHAEASLAFAYRHFRAAYELRSAHSYCIVTTCVEITADPYGLCDLHATYRTSIAA